MQGTGSVKKCVQNVLAGVGLGATGGLLTAVKAGDVASIADIAKIAVRGGLKGGAAGGLIGAAPGCLYGLAGG